MKHELFDLTACTVFAQTLMTRCCCVRSLRDWSFLQLQVPLGWILPVSPPLYFYHSCLLYLLHVPITVRVAPRRVMMMSPLCLSLVLTVFLKNVCVVRLGLLYFCVKSWKYFKKHVQKGMQPRDWTKKKGMMMGRGSGTFADGNPWIWSLFVTVFVVKCRSC